MRVQDVRRVGEAFDDMMAAIDGAAPDMTPEELVCVAEELEVVGHALTSITTARAAQTTAAGDQAHEARSHRVGRDGR
jgi:hypothetical protein